MRSMLIGGADVDDFVDCGDTMNMRTKKMTMTKYSFDSNCTSELLEETNNAVDDCLFAAHEGE